ncbi:MAG TPA: oxidoreductase [Clostridiales bacterium]|nr:oxidoreductase [Clostridiales bacterium]
MNTIRFGIAGCGMIADWHAQSILHVEGAELVGASSRNPKSRDAFCLKYGIKPFESYEAMLKDPSVDAICICTPSGLHASMAVQAAQAGKHIVVEKPMAITTAECDQMIEACEKYNVLLSVIFQSRYSKPFRQLKNAVDKGWLGRMTYGDVYMKFIRDPAYYTGSTWKGTWNMDGGGALMNQGIHGVDLLLYLMGDVKSVYGHAKTLVHDIETDDTTSAVVEYKSGALGIIQASTSVYPGVPRKIEISGNRGTVVVEEDVITSWDIKDMKVPEDVIVTKNDDFSAADPSAFTIEGHVNQFTDIVNSFRQGKRPFVDQYEGKRSVELVCAVYDSSKKGIRIDFDR